MSPTEDLLRAALAARADLVQPEHLTAGPPPRPGTAASWWRRPGPNSLLIAAVLVLLIGVPLLTLGLRGGDEPDDRFTDPDIGIDPERLEVDIDGDGIDDPVTLVRDEADEDGRSTARVEVEFSQFPGETATHRLGEVGDVAFWEPTDVDGRNGVELFVSIASSPGDDSSTLKVLAFRDGTLASIVDRPLVEGLVDGRLSHWWVTDQRLFSTTSTGPVSDDDAEYPVDAVRWDPGEGSLTEVPIEGQCVTATAPDELHPCGSGDGNASADGWWDQVPDGLPSTYGMSDGTPALDADADGDGADESISVGMNDTGTGNDLTVEDDGQSATTPLPADQPLIEGVVSPPGSDAPVIAVSTQDGFAGDGQVETEYAWGFHTFANGRLRELRVTGSPLPTGQVSDSGKPRPITTWLEGDRVYTLEYLDEGTETATHPDHPDGLTVFRVRVHEWSISGRSISPTALGEGCVSDLEDDSFVTACPEE